MTNKAVDVLSLAGEVFSIESMVIAKMGTRLGEDLLLLVR